VAFCAEVDFWAEVLPVPVEVGRVVSASSVSANRLPRHFGKNGSRPYNYYVPLPCDFLSQPSHVYMQKTHLLGSSLVGLQPKVS